VQSPAAEAARTQLLFERVHGLDRLPDRAVYGLETPREPVYAVSFRSDDLWGPDERPAFTVLHDLWESYLEPAA
jgi:hypothetical protein